MNYQIIRLTDKGRERVHIGEYATRAAANEFMRRKAMETDSILYLLYYAPKAPEWCDMIIATATPSGEIVNY